MTKTMRSVVKGSNAVETSVAGKNILLEENLPKDRNQPVYSELAVSNFADCHLIINGGVPVFIPANIGVSLKDIRLNSVAFAEDGVEFIWIGAC